jgi:hypothetical protein
MASLNLTLTATHLNKSLEHNLRQFATASAALPAALQDRLSNDQRYGPDKLKTTYKTEFRGVFAGTTL